MISMLMHFRLAQTMQERLLLLRLSRNLSRILWYICLKEILKKVKKHRKEPKMEPTLPHKSLGAKMKTIIKLSEFQMHKQMR